MSVLAERLPHWRRYALCRGQAALFYASDATSEAIACAICVGCGVRERCAADTAECEHDPAEVYGTRAGCTAAQRVELLRRRQLTG